MFYYAASAYGYTVTYYSGNCDPNNVNNLFGETYSATDLTSAVAGQRYNVLSMTNPNLIGDDFLAMYNDVFDGGFGVPVECATFLGWKSEHSEMYTYGGCVFSSETNAFCGFIPSYDFGDNLNLYAYCNWTKWDVEYYDCNNNWISSTSLKFGDSFMTPSVSGYTFNGWNYKGQLLENTFPANLCVKGENPLKLYADCIPETYNIIYQNVEDTDVWADNPPLTYTYGTGVTIGVPSRTNYVFQGWCVGQNNENCTDYTNNVDGYTISTTDTGDVYLWAKWKTLTVNLTWLINDQQYTENQLACEYGLGTIDGIQHKEIPGYKFTGWRVTNWQDE